MPFRPRCFENVDLWDTLMKRLMLFWGVFKAPGSSMISSPKDGRCTHVFVVVAVITAT